MASSPAFIGWLALDGFFHGVELLRILQANGLTLERHTARRPGRTHDGVVVALRSNVRWCCDHLELACRDGAVVRILFAIDACDREIIAWSATTAGISGEMVRDLMLVCVERRFGAARTPHPVEWLSDNGSAYIARETSDMATALGLRLAFTPVRSPESNGISEAFVKTLKRDYARHNILVDAPTVMALLPSWCLSASLNLRRWPSRAGGTTGPSDHEEGYVT